ncbi:MAG: hypothetical protein ACI9UU_001889, partial [Candidatus Azotimanducaceae bacterium]
WARHLASVSPVGCAVKKTYLRAEESGGNHDEATYAALVEDAIAALRFRSWNPGKNA